MSQPSSQQSRFMLENPDSGIWEHFACESRTMSFGIQNKAQGIRNPTKDWNP